jgi:transposase
MGVDIGKNSFHVIGLDRRGAIVLRQKWSRSQIEVRVANNLPRRAGQDHGLGPLRAVEARPLEQYS